MNPCRWYKLRRCCSKMYVHWFRRCDVTDVLLCPVPDWPPPLNEFTRALAAHLRRWTEGATYIRQGDHHVGHWPTYLVCSFTILYGSLSCLSVSFWTLLVCVRIVLSLLSVWIAQKISAIWKSVKYSRVGFAPWPPDQGLCSLIPLGQSPRPLRSP